MKTIVRENMSDHLITIGWNERMDVAFQRMQESRVRHLPVLSEAGEVVGMLSDRDVQRAMISTIEHEPLSKGVSETLVFDSKTRVRDYMSWPAQVINQNTDLRLVAERMIHEKISSFLVSHGTRITGIVTAEDLLKVLVTLLADPKNENQWTLSHILDEALGRLNNTLV